MNSDDEERRAICILSLDSGGPGTYSQLLILKEYMSRLAHDLGVAEDDVYPAEHFDLIGGVGFGGLVAIMLGRLKMNADDAIEAFKDVVSAIFPNRSRGLNDPEKNSRKLKEVIEELLQSRDVLPTTKMHEPGEPQTRCKVVLYAATSGVIDHPQAFRTHSIRGPSLNPTIVQAICATISIPSHFEPVIIGLRSPQSFIGGPLGANNPTRELLKEASTIFGNDKRVAQIISIGCGVPAALSLTAIKGESGEGRLLKEVPVECQKAADEIAMRFFYIEAYLRLSVEKGMERVGMHDWSVLGDIEAHTNTYVQTEAITHAINTSLERLRKGVCTVTLSRLNQPSATKTAAKTAPPVTPYFVRRDKEWGEMVWHLVTSPASRQRILPITGMGGCGKTQMVSYFLQEHPSLFKHVVFVDASTFSSIETDFQIWIRTLGDGHALDLWEDAIRILGRVPKEERWGLILDNADDPTLNIAPFIPQNISLTVIITSRNRTLGNLSTTYHMELGEMEEGEALKTLLHAARRQLPLSPKETTSAHTLLKELGCLAVALVQTGTYCHELSCTFTHYLSLFYSHRAELMKTAEPSSLDGYQRGAYTTLDLSYKALSQQAREFIHFASFFHHTDIPLTVLATAAEYGFEDPWCYIPRPEDHANIRAHLRKLLCVNDNWSNVQVQEILRTLRSFSLISASSTDDSIFLQLHPLIQAWSRDMDPSTSLHYRRMACQVLTTCVKPDAFLLRRYLLPHVLDMLDQTKLQDMHINDLMGIGSIFQQEGRYRVAIEVFDAALKIMNGTTQPDEEKVLVISQWLASTYLSDGRWIEAEKLEVKVLEQWRRILGLEHPDTIRAAGYLAVTYTHQGRLSEAEKLQVEVLEQQRRILGLEHPDTISAAENLAATYTHQGRLSEAEKLQVEVLEQRRRILGLEHPDTIRAAGYPAATYTHQGRLSEAEKLQVEVLEQRRRILGLEHPDTISAAGYLAATYTHQGRLSEAEKLEVEVLEQRRRILGLEHLDTIRAAGYLAATYTHQGRLSEAEKLQVEVLEHQRRILGLEHPETILAAANLVVTYMHQGRLSEAEKLQVEVLEQRRRILGLEHPDTIRAAGYLAATYTHQGRLSEAEKLQVEVLEQRRRILGLEHPDTISAAANLAATYTHQGRLSEAEKMEVEVLEQRRRILGLEHPDTIRAAGYLAVTYTHQGRLSEAEKLQVEVLEQRRRILGLEHPDTISAAGYLAVTYTHQGRLSEAEKLQVEVLEQRRRILGLEHPDTIRAAGYLAATYTHQGRLSEAEKLQVEVLEQRRRILGLEHPDTIQTAADLAVTYMEQRQWNECASLLVPAVELSLKVLGQQHPSTQLYLRNLAHSYNKLGKNNEAQETSRLLITQPTESQGRVSPARGLWTLFARPFRPFSMPKVRRMHPSL